MYINNNNNNRFLYSAFPNYDQSASQCIITPVIGFSHNSALRVHFLHSLGSIPASRRFTGAHNANSTTITFASYRVPIYTPGWRAAMWIKCLAEGQKCRALTGIEPGTLWFRVKGSIQYTTAPPHSTLTTRTGLQSMKNNKTFGKNTLFIITSILVGWGLRADTPPPPLPNEWNGTLGFLILNWSTPMLIQKAGGFVKGRALPPPPRT